MRNLSYLILICIAIGTSCKTKESGVEQKETIPAEDTVTILEEQNETLYGIEPENFEIKRMRVRRNETLAKILYATNIPANDVNTLVNKSTSIFDTRKFKAGNHYVGFYNKTNHQPRYLVYEIDKFEYLFFSLQDSLYVDRIHRETDTITQYAAFSIKNSLWLTMKEQDLDPMLAIMLSEIYAWTIDFYGLQEGDSIRVVYDEVKVEDKKAGITKIHSAWFRHINHDYYAVLFNQDGKEGYFDLEGNSLRKAFLKAPLRFNRISSRFSHSRLHPILKIRRPHHGVDYAAPVGTPVHAIGDGTIVKIAYTKGAGRIVKIKHNSVYTTAYMHLSRFGKGITKGAYVKQGQTIGYVGSSGLSTGPHLDFRVYKNGYPVDPLKIESPPVEPIKRNNIPSFYESIYLALKDLKIDQAYFANKMNRKNLNSL